MWVVVLMDFDPVNDFWEYNPTNNTWTQKAIWAAHPDCQEVHLVLTKKAI